MSRVRAGLVFHTWLLLCTVASLPSGVLNAQQTLAATARISSRPITGTGPDSGKYIVSLEINGIPDGALQSLKPDQLLLVDEAGRAYTPSGWGPRTRGKLQTNPLAAYLTTSENISERRYIYIVAPGSRSFDLRVAGLKPVRVNAPLLGFAR